jgi:hypothetical protein
MSNSKSKPTFEDAPAHEEWCMQMAQGAISLSSNATLFAIRDLCEQEILRRKEKRQ